MMSARVSTFIAVNYRRSLLNFPFSTPRFSQTHRVEVFLTQQHVDITNPFASALLYSTSATGNVEKQKSKRMQFREIPVRPDVLRYIETIGVGIPSRKRKDRARRNGSTIEALQGRRSIKNRNLTSDGGGRNRVTNRRGTRQQPKVGSKTSNTSSISIIRNYPPPPFSSSSFDYNSMNNDTNTVHWHRRRPVIIGSVGSTKEPFPSNDKDNLIAEVALAGRSNVGKSTLLNALLYGNQPKDVINVERRGRKMTPVKLGKGQKALVSNKPGETRCITFYQLSSSSSSATRTGSNNQTSLALRLVDLPGYGFAYAQQEHKEQFQGIVQKYFVHRGKALKRVLLLLDARHGMKKADVDFLEAIQEDISSECNNNKSTNNSKRNKNRLLPPIQIILTKCDLVSQEDLARRVTIVKEQLSDTLRREPSSLPVMFVSAKAGVGFNNIDRRTQRAMGGVLELQKELAGLAVHVVSPTKTKQK